jgi:hypothetical protein
VKKCSGALVLRPKKVMIKYDKWKNQ